MSTAQHIPSPGSPRPSATARALVVLVLAFCASSGIAAATRASSSTALSRHVAGRGYAIAVPAGRRVARDGGCMRIDAPDMRAIEEYTLDVCAFKASLRPLAACRADRSLPSRDKD